MLISKEDCAPFITNYSEKITSIEECRKRKSCFGCPFFSDGTKTVIGCSNMNLIGKLIDILKYEDFGFNSKEVLYEEVDF